MQPKKIQCPGSPELAVASGVAKLTITFILLFSLPQDRRVTPSVYARMYHRIRVVIMNEHQIL